MNRHEGLVDYKVETPLVENCTAECARFGMTGTSLALCSCVPAASELWVDFFSLVPYPTWTSLTWIHGLGEFSKCRITDRF